MKINCNTPPEVLAIIHAQGPKLLKVSKKMAVPMRKTMNPTILNLMKRKIQSNTVAPKLFLNGRAMFVMPQKLFHNIKVLAIFKQSTLSIFYY
jgi:hypothetical protein